MDKDKVMEIYEGLMTEAGLDPTLSPLEDKRAEKIFEKAQEDYHNQLSMAAEALEDR